MNAQQSMLLQGATAGFYVFKRNFTCFHVDLMQFYVFLRIAIDKRIVYIFLEESEKRGLIFLVVKDT
jgi:hypothetical protein